MPEGRIAEGLGDAMEQWRRFGTARMPDNLAYFQQLVDMADCLAGGRQYETACVYASIAAYHAAARHSGIWASPDLDRILHRIARDTIPDHPPSRPRQARHRTERVCHVVSQVGAVGGLSKMLERWIKADHGRHHSVILTRQSIVSVPSTLEEAVAGAHGRIHFIDNMVGGLIKRAQALRELAAEADVVVLHVHAYDVVPILAFATRHRPPVVYLDHADHSFWPGTSIVDVFASMREAGRRLMVDRRGIEPDRIMMLPTILDERRRRLSIPEAKLQLGIPQDRIVLCTVARARKYATMGSTTYADLHVPTLQQHPGCTLLAVGPGGKIDWSAASRETGGRVTAIPEQEDTAKYFQAADIYLDSFPFVSITSVLEAGCYGTPAVSIFPYSNEALVMGSNMPGLDGTLVTCRSLDEYQAALSQLISDPAYRLSLGSKLQTQIERHHYIQPWLQSLEAIYSRSLDIYRESDLISSKAVFAWTGEPDVFIQAVHGGDPDARRDTDRLLKFELGVLPLAARLSEWWRLFRLGLLHESGKYGPAIHLLPEWLRCRLWRLKRRQPWS